MITISETAHNKIKNHLEKRGTGLGVRVSVKKTGCSGYSYVLDYVDTTNDSDIVYEQNGYNLYVDNKSEAYLKGMNIDYKKEGLNESFVFDNPNAEEYCGCGESFTVRSI